MTKQKFESYFKPVPCLLSTYVSDYLSLLSLISKCIVLTCLGDTTRLIFLLLLLGEVGSAECQFLNLDRVIHSNPIVHPYTDTAFTKLGRVYRCRYAIAKC